MKKVSKGILIGTLMLVALFLTWALVVPSMTNGQTTSYYAKDSHVNPAAFTLTMYSPNNQTAYNNTMLLKFNITWTQYPEFQFTFGPPLNGYYAYSIDNNPLVSVASNQSASDYYYATPSNNFTVNPSFSYSVDISNLTNGYHKIVLNVSLYGYRNQLPYFDVTTSPTLFLVENPIPTTTPTSIIGALISPLNITIITVVVLAVVAIFLIVYRMHRKTQ